MSKGKSEPESSLWLRPKIEEPATVLLIGAGNNEYTRNVCQKLLTTVSYRQESILAIGYGERKRTWLDNLEYEPANLTIKWLSSDQVDYDEIGGLQELENGFQPLSIDHHRIVYFDNASSMFKDSDDFVTSYKKFQHTISRLSTMATILFSRIDPTIHTSYEIETISKQFDYVATLDENTGNWEIKESILADN
ncbi:hypothetical protein HYG81_22530 (plasmid) [Natrinema zhouii]|uniref:hypothetical protein n=1 Tax=Natrinema zhouii TaxID=1710539 RepID=UPI001CFFD4B7|nr:hypothetical protein [Natrinema zhouii]UHQ98738.1 hypothetical protein HYG81_22530 [Natrinema zhouii]